ncbi:MAG: 4Fe-4S dicluster domain-containing protein [Gammaproteobacteria bacterium]|nr:4Fe-4S dicluster domain-containing protein [Gammaproteobacteria bacterium]MDE0253144.1 4Fe-4S dicluster domain-containing protein [Gammaproteobacteria bacterium]MDE0402369.1 4Fe-4S dicluster domain-containing protein [Gammaproteobacteria bacterium]
MSSYDPTELDWFNESPTTLLDRIRDANVVGMGGAGYPAAEKIEKGSRNAPCTIIANGVESDPGVSADQTLLNQRLLDVITGLRIVGHIAHTKQLHLVVTSSDLVNKASKLNSTEVKVHLIRPTFQNGEERELIKLILQKQVEPNSYPTDFGIIVFNVHTLFAILEAVRGKKLTQRIMTVLGEDRWVKFGEAIHSVVDVDQSLRTGCYETGHVAINEQQTVPTMNAISVDASDVVFPCIKCGWCTSECPLTLPVELYQSDFERNQISDTTRSTLYSCNECGACVTKCPSHIHLVDTIRQLRADLAGEEFHVARAAVARKRYEARVQRLQNQSSRETASRVERMHKTHDWS